MTSITIWTYEITVLIFQWTTVLLLENNLYARKSTTIGFWHITTKVLSFRPSGRYFGQTLICPSFVKTLKQEIFVLPKYTILLYENDKPFYVTRTDCQSRSFRNQGVCVLKNRVNFILKRLIPFFCRQLFQKFVNENLINKKSYKFLLIKITMNWPYPWLVEQFFSVGSPQGFEIRSHAW